MQDAEAGRKVGERQAIAAVLQRGGILLTMPGSANRGLCGPQFELGTGGRASGEQFIATTSVTTYEAQYRVCVQGLISERRPERRRDAWGARWLTVSRAGCGTAPSRLVYSCFGLPKTSSRRPAQQRRTGKHDRQLVGEVLDHQASTNKYDNPEPLWRSSSRLMIPA